MNGQPAETSDPAARFNAALETLVPRYHQMGLRVLKLSGRHVIATVPLGGNENHYGTMFAGALFAVAETLGGALAMENFGLSSYYPTVQEFTVQFRRPAVTDVTVSGSLDAATLDRLSTELEATGKTAFELDTTILDADGQTVATTHGTYRILTRR
jgi:thioesterase domain-containing protein